MPFTLFNCDRYTLDIVSTSGKKNVWVQNNLLILLVIH